MVLLEINFLTDMPVSWLQTPAAFKNAKSVS